MGSRRLPMFVLLSAVAAALAMGLATEGRAQGFSARAYGSYSYRVPYCNDYHGYWRDQGYGFTGRRYGNRVPYWNGYHGYWRDQGYGFARQPRYGGSYYYESYGGFGPVCPNVR